MPPLYKEYQMSSYTLEQVQNASEKSGLSITAIAKACNIKLPDARETPKIYKTLAAARNASFNFDAGSEEEYHAHKQWRQFSATALQEATTINQIKEVIGLAPENSEEKRLAQVKWGKLSAAEVAAATTVTACIIAYNNSHPESDESLEAIKKSLDLFNTTKEAKLIFDIAKAHSPEERRVLREWIRLNGNLDELVILHTYVERSSVEERQLLTKIVELANP